ncbi:store-operated calcium entry-associated regulatory factor [Kipferlia bialata]|uniref:Store-operated calcium entry-associated regulatory factor n=1 Tax=Kipferlia bialata TaxID=797122 RepID=A0A9K3GJJ9_9EUKA|nr:store-operated calcium entry-associated regulatory factor [Kipferlia bialata]|eukprot:g8047.t1
MQRVSLILAVLALASVCMAQIHMADITALTFRSNEMTKSRRGDYYPSLAPLSSKVPARMRPDTVQCKNVGWDGESVSWECEAVMPKGVEFGHISISCEGWSGPGDMMVVPGSCQLEYALEFKDYDKKIETPYEPKQPTPREEYKEPAYGYKTQTEYVIIEEESHTGLIMFTIFAGLTALSIWWCCRCFKRCCSGPRFDHEAEEVL